jgi:hypothetical protein
MAKPANTIAVGLWTQFHATYQDGNPLWEVTKKRGRGVWEARVPASEPDFGGVTKVFTTAEIQRSLSMANLFKGIRNSHDDFYAGLKVGQVVHYYDGLASYIRCQAVRMETGKMELVPVALLGKWSQSSLPSRMPDGSIHRPYHAKNIAECTPFNPAASNIYECPQYSKKPGEVNPATLPALDLSVPELSKEAQAEAKLWLAVQDVRGALERRDRKPQDILLMARQIIEGALS